MKSRVAVTISLAVCVILMTSWCDARALSPPLLPSVFSVQFEETLSIGRFLLIKNKGAMYYDYDSHQQRMDHGRGQMNNFCWNQHLSDADSTAPCRILFSNDSALYIDYPEARNCCRLCSAAQGCGALNPSWMHGARYFGEEQIGGSTCYGWGKPGYVAAEDMWYATQSGRPCRYHEVVFPTTHNLTFVASTFSRSAISSEVFAVPEYCHRSCPKPLQTFKDLAANLAKYHNVESYSQMQKGVLMEVVNSKSISHPSAA